MTRNTQESGLIINTPLDEVMSEKYLSYALSTIVSRSLPDVRDGMKPVHRRILYAMRQLSLRADGMPKKSARVIGDVIGKFHPHGDASVYDALVRLAQDFAVRYPLVYGQGNFGNIDGDNAAAMRYTESKMTTVSEALLEGLDEDTVDFRATYDGDGKEPVVLPAAFPNLLANGSSGIAVGMATNIPPHNVGEICDALDQMLRKKSSTIEEILSHIQGPDFPTGGVLVEPRENIIAAYKTGRGSFRTRAKWEKEDLGQGIYQIIITEIPYQVQKSNLIEKIADLLHDKKLPLLDDVRDESAEDIRIVITPKSRNVEADVLMQTLFRHTDLENKFSLNMNVLDGGTTPRVMNIREVLQAFLNHRMEVLIRRSQFQLDKIEKRLEVLEGYLIAYLNLDEVIRIIRFEDEPKEELIKAFNLTEVQADAILNMRLKNLRKLEEQEIRNERDQLQAERGRLQELLSSEDLRWKDIRGQVREMKHLFGGDDEIGRRRTLVSEAPVVEEVPIEAYVEKEPITVLISQQGWVRALKGHIKETGDQKYKEGDRERFVLHCQTTDKLLVVGTMGRVFTLGADKLPRGRGFGEPIRLMFAIADDADIVNVLVYDAAGKILIAGDDGRGFIVPMADVEALTKNGKVVLNLKNGEALAAWQITEGDDHIAVIGENRKLNIFPMDDVPEMTRGRGVILQRYKDGGLSDARTFKLEEGLSWQQGSNTRTETDLRQWLGKRAAAGRMPPHGFPKTNKF